MYKALIFDMDGTLTKPVLDFGAIRREIGLPAGDLAVEIASLAAPDQERAWAVIRLHEAMARENQALQEGCLELLEECRRHEMKLGILTRNEKSSVEHLCRRFDLCFDVVVTREFEHIKPHPGPVLHMLGLWQLMPVQALMIGDYIHDIECGRAAGADTCFFLNPGCPDFSDDADYTVSSMQELHRLVFGNSIKMEG